MKTIIVLILTLLALAIPAAGSASHPGGKMLCGGQCLGGGNGFPPCNASNEGQTIWMNGDYWTCDHTPNGYYWNAW